MLEEGEELCYNNEQLSAGVSPASGAQMKAPSERAPRGKYAGGVLEYLKITEEYSHYETHNGKNIYFVAVPAADLYLCGISGAACHAGAFFRSLQNRGGAVDSHNLFCDHDRDSFKWMAVKNIE